MTSDTVQEAVKETVRLLTLLSAAEASPTFVPPPMSILSYMGVLCLFMTFMGGAVFLLMRRAEMIHTALVRDYRTFLEKVSADHGRMLESQMANAASLLELGLGMARGQSEIVSSLSSAYSRDHIAAGLKLIQLLLESVGRSNGDKNDKTESDGSEKSNRLNIRQEVEKLLGELGGATPAPTPDETSVLLPEEMG